MYEESDAERGERKYDDEKLVQVRVVLIQKVYRALSSSHLI